jgi:cold shock CspA family protein
MTGKIKRINTDRFFGFIAADGDPPGAPNHFFHGNDLVNMPFHQIREGQVVEFESVTVPKGLAAKRVIVKI